MTWQQITVACPHCGQSRTTYRDLLDIKYLCPGCGGWFCLSSELDSTGLPIPVAVASPDEVSLTGSGGWKEHRRE